MIQDFISSALPWVSMGLMIAIIAAGSAKVASAKLKADAAKSKEDVKKGRKNQATAFYLSSALCYVTSLLMMFFTEGHTYIVWMTIGSMLLLVGSSMIMKINKEDQESKKQDPKEKA